MTTAEPRKAAVMPLIHQARRTRRNRIEGNRFATDATIEAEIAQLSEAYMATQDPALVNKLKVEIDNLESLF